MLVSEKHETGVVSKSSTHSFPELIGKRYEVIHIDVRAIFYAHASPETELLGRNDYIDETGLAVTGQL